MYDARSLDGPALDRFIRVVTLLSLIDPVRGEPTVHSLDSHPHDHSRKQEHLLRKFLDAFAWICSTGEKGAETASAVCLEQNQLKQSILRLAQNAGTPSDILEQLQQLLEKLTLFASGVYQGQDKESEILHDVIAICEKRIRFLIRSVQNNTQLEESREFICYPSKSWLSEEMGFKTWLSVFSSFLTLHPDAPTNAILPYVQWASQARWKYAEQLDRFFGWTDTTLPHWIFMLYKIGRYHVAVKSLIKFAQMRPEVFESMQLKVVEAPVREPRFLTEETGGLQAVLEKCGYAESSGIISQLGVLWCNENPGKYYLKRSKTVATVHAEMQLLIFYDHNPSLKPPVLFMGTSKKACYLCYQFMERHHLSMRVSASHQKLYPSWAPAWCSDSKIRVKHKALLWELTRHMEKITGTDLRTTLGLRRPNNLDSTAGPSLTSTGSMVVD